MANTAQSSINVVPLDFVTYRNSLITYLQQQDRFKDYNFDGSNLSVLIDLLSYNTFNTGFYGNMIGAEMFQDSAQLRDSNISHAKDLNYTPRSNMSATANINLTFVTTDGTTSLVIPKYTTFTGRVGSNNYTFSTNSAISAISDTNLIAARNITIYEGILNTDQWVYSPNTNQRFILSNPNIDTSSLFVAVIEDGGSTLATYTLATSLFNLDANSEVYFLQAATNGNYEIIFGDGISGRVPKNGAVISAEYRISSGSFANSISTFTSDGLIDNQANCTVYVNSGSTGGAFAESIASIKFNAPRHFATQERAVAPPDYESLLMKNFPEIFAVSAIGGEDLDPPQFGKVSITVALTGISSLPASKIATYTNFLQSRMSLASKPLFANPNYLYVGVNSNVDYNINITGAEPDTISTIVKQTVAAYNSKYLNKFNASLRYSPLGTSIDNSDTSILGNETNLQLIQRVLPRVNINATYNLSFGQALSNVNSITSSLFYYRGQLAVLQDADTGIVNIVSAAAKNVIAPIGSVNRTIGTIAINNITLSGIDSVYLKIYANPLNKDLYGSQGVIMLIDPSDVFVNAIPVAE